MRSKWEQVEKRVLDVALAALLILIALLAIAYAVMYNLDEAEAVGPQQYEVITTYAEDRQGLSNSIAENIEGRMPQCITTIEVESNDEYSYTAVIVLSC